MLTPYACQRKQFFSLDNKLGSDLSCACVFQAVPPGTQGIRRRQPSRQRDEDAEKELLCLQNNGLPSSL
jgi:hypothetical protein